MPQGRRVRRVIRRVEPWTVLRFSVFFYLSIFLVLLVAGEVLWQVASGTGRTRLLMCGARRARAVARARPHRTVTRTSRPRGS